MVDRGPQKVLNGIGFFGTCELICLDRVARSTVIRRNNHIYFKSHMLKIIFVLFRVPAVAFKASDSVF